MEVWKKMEEFEGVSSEYQKIGSYIRKQDPFRYQEEYGTDFIHYTDENLMDMFIDSYEELRNIPYLLERLKIYEIIDLLNGYRKYREESQLEEASEKARELLEMKE